MLLFPILSPWNDSLRLYPYPMLALMLLGFTLGFIAWVAHSTIIRRLIRLVGANGDSDKGNNNQQPPPKQ
jgi:hypothetical protein